MPTVNIDGDASGAIAACAAAQGAIEALHGKSVTVDINVRQSGGGGGLGGATRDMEKFGIAADKAQQHVDRLNGSANKAHNSVGKLGDKSGAASDHVDRLGESSRSSSDHVDRLASSSSDAHDPVSGLGGHAKTASGSVGGLGTRANTTSGHLDKLGASASNAHDPLQAIGGLLGNLGGGRGGGGSGSGGGSSLLGGLIPQLGPATMGLKAVGLAGGISALGIGALSAAVAGVGLAGVAEDFAHNSQLMHAGAQAVRGFNKEFSAMKGATSAAGGPAMAGLASSMKGVGHELASIGAANIAPVLNSVSSLGNQATQAMRKLEPAIGPATQGLTALAGSVIGAFGDSGPAVAGFANTVTSHAPQIQAGLSAAIGVMAGLGGVAVDTVAAFGSVDTAMQNMVQPGGHPGADVDGNTIKNNMDRMLGARRDPSSGGVSSLGHWGDYDSSTGLPKPGSPAAAGYAKSQAVGLGESGSGAPVAPGQFDPSKPFSGSLPDGKGGFTPGTGDGGGAKPSAPKPVRLPQGNFGKGIGPPSLNDVGSPDAAQFKGMTAGQIMESQRSSAGLAPTGAPTWDGLGGGRPGGAGLGPGSAFRPTPAAMSAPPPPPGGTALPGLMQSMQSQLSAGAGDTGAAAVKHITKAVNSAAPAAAAGGASLGGAMSGGMAQGMNSTQSVVDTVTIKHSKHIIDIASAALGIHSPSEEFDYLGRMTWAGFGRGSDREAPRTFGAMSDHMGGALSGAQGQARKFGYDYQDSNPGVTVSVKKPATPEEYQQAQQAAAERKASFGTQQHGFKPGSEGWWSAHDNRAGQLAAGREDRQRSAIGGMTHDERRDMLMRNRANSHERALANLGISGHAKTSGDTNPFAAEQNRSKGLNAALNPFSRLPGLMNQAGQNSAQGLTQGMAAHMPKIQAAGASAAGAAHGGYKKKDKQSSPSAEWAAMAGNSIAGAVGGMNAGIPALAAAGAGAAGAMQAATSGPMADSGLMVGFAWAQNVETGVSMQIKKADYRSLGLPQLGQSAMAGLAATGLLRAGSGAQSYKTPGNTSGVVTLTPASGSSGGNQTITLQHQIDVGGQIHEIATKVTLDMFGKFKDAVAVQAR